MPVLEIHNLRKVFRSGSMFATHNNVAVDDLNISLLETKPWVLSIVGESGSGKTTLARMVLQLLEPTSGTIEIDGVKLRGQLANRQDQRAFKRTVQPVFQNPFDTFSARRKVAVYLRETAMNLGIARSDDECRRVVAEALRAVGLEYSYVDGKYSRQFSGGELQRIAIARALVARPSLIIADEPVASIDASLKMNIINLFLRLKEEYGTSFVYITHDLSTAYYVSDYIGIMYQGKLVEYGPSKEILVEPAHPYTMLLMDSIAQVGKRWFDDATPIASRPAYRPGLSDRPASGCRFAARCQFAKEICRTSDPIPSRISTGRWSLCFRHSNYERVENV